MYHVLKNRTAARGGRLDFFEPLGDGEVVLASVAFDGATLLNK